jgi:crotonobetainyl-CoA:carnitine CoA-transferase CaiB-like acyl-CoA transferase
LKKWLVPAAKTAIGDKMSKPFTGIRVLDFTRYLAGPFGSYQLALMGADVIKVEPFEGDTTRVSIIDKDSPRTKMAPNFMAVNANKRSITADLRSTKAIAALKRMVSQVDVVWENFRPGIMAKMGLDYASLSAINPRLIYCSVSGFGHTGPQSPQACFDGKIQAMSGIMSLTGEASSGAMRAGFAICDVMTGMTSALAVSSALFQRTHTGKGQFVDVAMLDSALNYLAIEVTEHTLTGIIHKQRGNMTISRRVTGNRFATGDGFIVLAALTEKQFAGLLTVIGRADALSDPRFKDWPARAEHEPALREIIERGLAIAGAHEWERRLTAADVPCAAVIGIEEVVRHPQLQARDVLQRVHTEDGEKTLVGAGFRLAHGSPGIDRPPARLGEHTLEVLREFGFSRDEVDDLTARGAVRSGTASQLTQEA